MVLQLYRIFYYFWCIVRRNSTIESFNNSRHLSFFDHPTNQLKKAKSKKWTALFIPIFKDIQLCFRSNEDSSTLKLLKYTLCLPEEMHHVSKVWRSIFQFWFILNFDNCENTCIFWSQNICSVNNKKKVNGHYVLWVEIEFQTIKVHKMHPFTFSSWEPVLMETVFKRRK